MVKWMEGGEGGWEGVGGVLNLVLQVTNPQP